MSLRRNTLVGLGLATSLALTGCTVGSDEHGPSTKTHPDRAASGEGSKSFKTSPYTREAYEAFTARWRSGSLGVQAINMALKESKDQSQYGPGKHRKLAAIPDGEPRGIVSTDGGKISLEPDSEEGSTLTVKRKFGDFVITIVYDNRQKFFEGVATKDQMINFLSSSGTYPSEADYSKVEGDAVDCKWSAVFHPEGMDLQVGGENCSPDIAQLQVLAQADEQFPVVNQVAH